MATSTAKRRSKKPQLSQAAAADAADFPAAAAAAAAACSPFQCANSSADVAAGAAAGAAADAAAAAEAGGGSGSSRSSLSDGGGVDESELQDSETEPAPQSVAFLDEQKRLQRLDNKSYECASARGADAAAKGGEEEGGALKSPTASAAAAAPVADATGQYFQNLLRERGVRTAPVAHRSPRDFYFMRILGEGSFSTVYFAKEVDTGEKYAIKVVSKDDIRRENKVHYVLRERDIMAALTYAYGGHPFIVKLYCTFQDKDRLYFAISYAKHGELLDWLRRLGSFDDAVTLFYASEILAALEFLHNCKIVHRDLKPENILVGEDWHILVSDFGTAKVLDLNEQQDALDDAPASITESDNSAVDKAIADAVRGKTPAQAPPRRKDRSSFVGTAQYISPEVLNSEAVGPECDYWALGAIIFQMISGQPPFRAVNEYQIMKKILGLNYSFPDGFPATARDLVQRLLVTKPARLGSRHNGGIDAIKRHAYFQSVDWEHLAQKTPPELKPYVPASKDEPAFYGDRPVTDEPHEEGLEPGLGDSAITRLLGLNFSEFEEFQEDGGAPAAAAAAAAGGKGASRRDGCGGGGADEEARRKIWRDEKLAAQQKQNNFHQFVEGNLIFKHGLIDKRKGLFARRRMFLLTEGPRLFYVDATNMELKGEIPLSADVRTEAKNFRTFFIHTPKRTYYLFDPGRHAKDWCDAIDIIVRRYFTK